MPLEKYVGNTVTIVYIDKDLQYKYPKDKNDQNKITIALHAMVILFWHPM